MNTDWSQCDLVEAVPEKVSGIPVVKGTRIFADTIAENFDLGMTVQEIHESYPSLPVETIRGLLEYERTHSLRLQP